MAILFTWYVSYVCSRGVPDSRPFAIGGLIDAFGTSDQSKRSQLTLFVGLSLGAFVALHLSALHSRYFVPRLRMFVQEQLFAFALSQPPLFFRVTLGGAVGDAISNVVGLPS